MVEFVEGENGELIGVTARNVVYLTVYGLTKEEWEEATNLMRECFGGKGYLYLRKANELIRKEVDDKKNEGLRLENEALKAEIAKKEASTKRITIGAGESK